uniref:Uncharacterized protein n=1 Tax=Rhizophora mucronata TaxID=61149 RepID=A0A2P2R309_RHIMU
MKISKSAIFALYSGIVHHLLVQSSFR